MCTVWVYRNSGDRPRSARSAAAGELPKMEYKARNLSVKEDGTDKLSRNVGKKLPHSRNNPEKTQFSATSRRKREMTPKILPAILRRSWRHDILNPPPPSSHFTEVLTPSPLGALRHLWTTSFCVGHMSTEWKLCLIGELS
jgi:hypothetical protein